VYIEEAAGISKYKERRRETANRMKRTKENMERLTDIRDELERQLQHLHRQAQAAEKFTTLKEQERLHKAQLHALQWQDLNQSVETRQLEIGRVELDLEAAITKQTNFDTQVESLFVGQADAREAFNTRQKRFYDIGSEIARFEQLIQNKKQRFSQLSQDLERIEANVKQTESILAEDKEKQDEWQFELEEIMPELEVLRETEESSQEILANSEDQMQEWQGAWDDFNGRASGAKQKAEVLQSRIMHAEKVLVRVDERSVKLEQEMQALLNEPAAENVAELIECLAEAEMQQETDQEQLDSLQQRIEHKRLEQSEQLQGLNEVNTGLQSKRGRLASLEALQQAALSEDNESVNTWLRTQGIIDNPLLAEKIDVQQGYEKAVETVLASQLQSICVDDVSALAESVAALESGAVSLLAPSNDAVTANLGLETLASKVNNPTVMQGLLQGVYVVESLDLALNHQSQLSPTESIVTLDGIWLSKTWLRRIDEGENNQAGVIKRKQEIEQLLVDIDADEEKKFLIEDAQISSQEELAAAERKRDELQGQSKINAQKRSELSSQLSAENLKTEQTSARKEQIQADLDDAKEQYQVEQETIAEARGTLEEAIDLMESDTNQREHLIETRDAIRVRLDNARERARADKELSYQLVMKEQSLKTQIAAVQQSFDRTKFQTEQLFERRDELTLELAEGVGSDDDASFELEALLDKRLQIEDDLTQARAEVERIEHAMREIEKERNLIQLAVQKLRTELEQSRLASQTWQVQRDNLQKQLNEAEFDVHEVIEGMPAEANESVWEEEIEAIGRRVSRLGAINLAAIEEYKVASERKTYLDTQNEDLEKALTTLENAIRKIDKETRLRFKDTFDQINAGVQELFPKVFGGGRAYLELTGEDLLDTGVAIMAQPPGKKNSTIHLLSGGEKALTAIALVFSIFKLNPAPFCILDEVDAPLDDANVGRYARMVKEMSSQVQFIYITHNKIAMEMADQLLGVTMHEPGCSRVVSVDVEEAAELAAL
ncbi:MAG: chromosome segregation protein SMC, partial [Sinobacterium sp.]|nr:chromosome segregation protein SMC [Sinobacterium sp.]